MAFLITETNYSGIQARQVIDESTGKKNYYIEGVFLQAEQKNRNGRIYPSAILEREVERYTREYITPKRAIGELNHPKEPSVNPERAAHLIQNLVREGNDWKGKSKVLSTPMGNIVKGLLEDDVQLGVSSRGLGTLTEKEGVSMVNEDYYMSTVDVVSDPSAPSAWVNGIYENVEYYMGDDHQFIEKIKTHIDKEASKVGFSMIEEEVALSAFTKFIQHLKG